MEQMTEKQLLPRLKRSIKETGNIAKWAAKHGYSRQFVGDVVKKKRPIPDSMFEAFGVQRVTEVRYYLVEE